jgi:hypothetical protein
MKKAAGHKSTKDMAKMTTNAFSFTLYLIGQLLSISKVEKSLSNFGLRVPRMSQNELQVSRSNNTGNGI